jgi:hypothetical protein
MITRRDRWIGIGILSALLLVVAYACWQSTRMNKAIVQATTTVPTPSPSPPSENTNAMVDEIEDTAPLMDAKSFATFWEHPEVAEEWALIDATKSQIGIFKSAVNLYKFHTRQYPPNLAALVIPVTCKVGPDPI